MSRLALDTTCLVAAVCQWHEHHAATAEAFEKSRARGDDVVMVAHALADAYSVLTRLPSPHRLPAAVAYTLLESNWGRTRTVALSSREYWGLLRSASTSDVTGGLFYDAVIAASAKKAGAHKLWTWNRRHLSRYEDGTLQVTTPADDAG